MQKYIDTVAVKNGARQLTPLVGGTVTVTTLEGAAAEIFDANGGLPRSSPLLTDINGAFSFYAVDGRYTITITGNGIVPITISDVLLEDPVDGAFVIVDGAIVEAKIGAGAVTTPKIIDGAVTTPKLADNAVTAAKLASDAVTNAKVAAGAAIAASKINYLPAGTGAVSSDLQTVLRETVSITRFGAVGDFNGTTGTDNYPAIQAAIDYLFLRGGGTLHFPKGFYRIAQPLNLTGSGTTGRFGNTPITFQGEGMPNAFDTGSWSTYGGTWIVGQTASWIADATGIQYFQCKDMGFRGTGTNASVNGILCARSTTVKFAHNHRFERCVIWVDTAPAATAVGSIAMANNGAETFVMEHCWLISDTPLALTFLNSLDLNLASAYVPIEEGLGFISSTMMNFRNTTFEAITGYATRLQGVLNVDFDTCIWSRRAGNTTIAGIQFVAGFSGNAHNQDVRITGQIENFPSAFRVDDSEIWNINTNVMMPSPTAPYVSTGGVVMNNCVWNIHHAFGSTAQPVINAISSAQMNGGEINVYAGGGVTSNTNLITNGVSIKGHNINLTGNLGLGGGSTYSSIGIGGTRIVNAGGVGIVPNAANNAAVGTSADNPTSTLSPDGVVRLSGDIIPIGATAIAAGVAAGTIAVEHRPNRECDAIVYVAGSIFYARVLTNGQLIFGGAVNAGQAANINGISYKLIN